MATDVLHTCTLHALTTGSEEVMGILLGDILVTRMFSRIRSKTVSHQQRSETGKSICRIWRCIPQIRTDRRKVRENVIGLLLAIWIVRIVWNPVIINSANAFRKRKS